LPERVFTLQAGVLENYLSVALAGAPPGTDVKVEPARPGDLIEYAIQEKSIEI